MDDCARRVAEADLDAGRRGERLTAATVTAECWTELFGETPPRQGGKRLWRSKVMIEFDPKATESWAEISVGKGAERRRIRL